MKNLKIFSLLLVLSLIFGACKDLLEPENDNHSTVERIYNDPMYAEGLLINAYLKIPTNTLGESDVATDDAVTNDKLNPYLRMATGEWSALYNPVSQWENCNSAVLYLNNFLEIIDTVTWKWTSEELNWMYARRFSGEAYALRGLFKYHLLVTTGGLGSNNQLLGIPLYNAFIQPGDNFNVGRETFGESIHQIYADFDKALEFLTMDDYIDLKEINPRPAGFEAVELANYNTVFGNKTKQRISGRIIKAMKARVALLAASPAFGNDNASLWEQAANYAEASVTALGGIAGLDANGHRFFNGNRVDLINLGSNIDQKEMIWRKAMVTTNSREQANYPPSLFGHGRINPSQNLVDAFPGLNGFPISNPLSLYDPANPYVNRDPRLALYIVYDGSKIGTAVIHTGLGGGTDAKDSISTSTRTGYYLKKLIREDVSVNPASTNTKKHYEVFLRATELFLIYAEAANEAWGPDGTGPNGFSARSVMAAIRKRGGITNDLYLPAIGTKEEMRELIRNERRIELCFEGFRFWDLRRWKADLNETVKGININKTSWSVVEVEERLYNNDYMHYGPVPEREVLKYNSLVQNRGW